MERDYFFNFEKFAYVKGPRPAGCILCMIREGNPSVADLSVYRDSMFIATVNLYPYNPGHLLLFPTRHVSDVRQLSTEEELRLTALTRYFLDLSDALYGPAGYNIGYNMQHAAGASIEHLHLHLIPRYRNELGIADLVAGKRVLVEDPNESARRIRERIAQSPFSSSSS